MNCEDPLPHLYHCNKLEWPWVNTVEKMKKKSYLCFLKRRSWPTLFDWMPVYRYKCSQIYLHVKEKVKKYFYFLKMCWWPPVIDEAQVAAHQQLRYLRWAEATQYNTNITRISKAALLKLPPSVAIRIIWKTRRCASCKNINDSLTYWQLQIKRC